MRGVRLHSLPLFLVLCVLVAVVAGACGGGGENFTGSNDGGLHDGTVLGDSRLFGDVASFGDAPAGALVILPANKVVDVTVGQPIPTVPYTANEAEGPSRRPSRSTAARSARSTPAPASSRRRARRAASRPSRPRTA